MKLLLVAATSFEIQPFISYCNSIEVETDHQIEVLITGVGMVATAFSLGRKLAAENFDVAINAGIAGSFKKSIEIGEIVVVKKDRFAELGAEDCDSFLTIDDMGFGASTYFPSFSNALCESLRSVSGITVNKVHGNANSIQRVRDLFEPDIESMEGAAFFYACREYSLPAVQFRCISNYVEPRNKDSWKIPLAIANLNEYLIRFIKQL